MEMNRYKVLETGWKVGYIEFVDNSEVITSMHKWRGYFTGSFRERTVYEYFKWHVYPKVFRESYDSLIKEKKDEEERGKKSVGRFNSQVAGLGRSKD